MQDLAITARSSPDVMPIKIAIDGASLTSRGTTMKKMDPVAMLSPALQSIIAADIGLERVRGSYPDEVLVVPGSVASEAINTLRFRRLAPVCVDLGFLSPEGGMGEIPYVAECGKRSPEETWTQYVNGCCDWCISRVEAEVRDRCAEKEPKEGLYFAIWWEAPSEGD